MVFETNGTVIAINLSNGSEIFRSEESEAVIVFGKPLRFKDKKITIGDREITTSFEEATFYLSPDGLKVLVKNSS